jgi:hypothetical protein
MDTRYYYTVITQQDMYASSEGDGKPVVEVAFSTTKDPTDLSSFLLTALKEQGIGNPSFVTGFSEVIWRLTLPEGVSPDRPDWLDVDHKVWIIRRFVP